MYAYGRNKNGTCRYGINSMLVLVVASEPTIIWNYDGGGVVWVNVNISIIYIL